jgi:5-formyltetrahydrofolate cyclo-ligase
MEDMKEKKHEIRADIAKIFESLSKDELIEKTKKIENRLFDFANYLESKITLLYIAHRCEVSTWDIIKGSFGYNKVVALPAFDMRMREMRLFKIENLDDDLMPGERGVLEPNPSRCKPVPIDFIDIAVIPGIAFDEKGGRIGSGEGYYDRLIPKLPVTTRKVALSLEDQIIQQIPMESNDKHVDIIITEERIIYKI